MINVKSLLSKITEKLALTELVISSYSSGWSYYNDDKSNRPTLRVYGNVVSLQGIMTNTTSKTLNATAQTIFDIPSQYAPQKHNAIAVMQGSDSNRYMLSVTTTGAVQFGRYTNGTSYTAQAAGKWFPFNITWIID